MEVAGRLTLNLIDSSRLDHGHFQLSGSCIPVDLPRTMQALFPFAVAQDWDVEIFFEQTIYPAFQIGFGFTLPADLTSDLFFMEYNYMHELRREEHWFARQLNQEGLLQDIYLDCCAKKKEFDYTDPAIRSLKMALERGLSHRLRCEALNAHRICILAVRKGIPETGRAVKMGGVKATLDYMVGLLEYWRSDDNKRFKDMLQAVTESANGFPHACMTADNKAPYFPFAKGDIFDDKALKKDLLIRLKDDEHPDLKSEGTVDLETTKPTDLPGLKATDKLDTAPPIKKPDRETADEPNNKRQRSRK